MKSIFSERLRRAMFLSGLRQADLIEKTGIDKGSISSYVSGRYKPNAEKVTKLAAALDVSPSWLIGQEPEGDPVLRRPDVVEEMPMYDGQPVFPDAISCQEMDLINAWRKAGDRERQIVKLTLGMK